MSEHKPGCPVGTWLEKSPHYIGTMPSCTCKPDERGEDLRGDFMEWVRYTHGSFSQDTCGGIKLQRHAVEQLYLLAKKSHGARASERARVVEWLRERAAEEGRKTGHILLPVSLLIERALEQAADALERGDDA